MSSASSIRKSYVDIGDGQIHLRERAGEDAPLVLLHQTASSSAMYDALMQAWPGPNRLIALDSPGFGGSFDPEGQPVMADYGAWIAEAIAALGIERYHLFGHHTGASIAVEIANAHPERLVSLSMIGPVVLSAEEREAFKGLYPKPFEPSADGAHIQKMWEYVRELGGENISQELWQREFSDTARAWRGHMQVYSTIWDQDFGALLERIDLPLMMMCSPNDVLWTVFDRARTAKPNAQIVELTGTNFQPDEEPDTIARALAGFVASNA